LVFVVGVLGLLAWLGASAAVARSSASLYYETTTSDGTLAIAKLNLTGPRTSSEIVDVGDANVFGIAVGAPYVFWTTEAGANDRGNVMRATLTGHGVRPLLAGLAAPDAVIAVNGFVYWSDRNAIGRVALNGSHFDRRFIVLAPEKGGGVADGLATDGTHLYFSRCLDDSIGRADLDGRHVIRSYVSTGGHASCPQGIAVGGSDLYWTELRAGTIGRAGLDGRGVDGRWLSVRTDEGPFQVVADAAHVYWTWGGIAGSPSWTGRVNADRSHFEPRFLADSLYPMALAGRMAIADATTA
jgi:hypothetical protein